MDHFVSLPRITTNCKDLWDFLQHDKAGTGGLLAGFLSPRPFTASTARGGGLFAALAGRGPSFEGALYAK